MSTKIVIADDHALFREGLRSLIEKKADMEVVGEAEDGRTAMRLVQELSPDLLIMDVKMPGLNGIEATRQIKKDFPEVKVLALSMYQEKQLISEMLKAGAVGYLLKEAAFKELEMAVRTVMDNKTYMCPLITGIVLEDYKSLLSEPSSQIYSALSDREREVLQLIAEGKSTKQIAELLYVSGKTVETHRRQIMNKLKIHTVAELTRFAIREGLTPI